ncbi:MAG: hypothetical protein QM756_41360 [Polyangiaceae bacterium]
MAPVHPWSDAWLLLSIARAGTARKGADLESVVAVGDYINRAIFTFEELDDGLARLGARALVRVREQRLFATRAGRAACEDASRRGGLSTHVERLQKWLNRQPPAKTKALALRRIFTRKEFNAVCRTYAGEFGAARAMRVAK